MPVSQRVTRGDRTQLFGALLLTALSGMAGLMHELLWTRRLVDLLGASGTSAARVFGTFFLGLALGSALSDRYASRFGRPWRAVAVAELLVGVLAIPVLALPRWTAWIWPTLGVDGLVSWIGAAAKWVAAVTVVLPPALCMGLVLPIIIRTALRRGGVLGRRGVALYATNTAGGVIGVLVAGIWALPAVGVTGSLLAAIGVNVLVALLSMSLDRATVPAASPAPRDAASTSAIRDVGFRGPALVAAFSGFGVLGFEVLALMLARQVVPSSTFGATALLATTIFVLALSAALAPFLAPSPARARTALAYALPVAAVWMAATPWFFSKQTHGMAYLLPSVGSFFGFNLSVIRLLLVTTGPALVALGVVFPLALAWLGAREGDRSTRHVGRLLALNGVGGLAGAEIASAVLPAVGGLHQGFAILAVLYVGAGLAVARSLGGRAHRLPAVSQIVSLVAIVFLSASVLPKLPRLWPGWGYSVRAEYTGREGHLSVVERRDKGRGLSLNNKYFLGGTGAEGEEHRQAHLPLLLHRDPANVAFIGLATGITAGAALRHGSVERLTAAELSPLVVRASREHFAGDNEGIHSSPRATVIVEDGRTFIAASSNRYDVVISDLFLPWRAGVGRLYSREHFQGVLRSLTRGGLFAQWLPIYQLRERHFDSILRTIADVFPTVHVFRGSYSTRFPVWAIVASDGPAIDWDGLDARCAALRAAGVLDPLVRSRELVAMGWLGRLGPNRVPAAPINTLDNAWLELDAGHYRVTRPEKAPYLSRERFVAFEGRLSEKLVRAAAPGWALDASRAGSLAMGIPQNAKIPDDMKMRFREQMKELVGDRLVDERARWPLAPTFRQIARLVLGE